MPNLRRDRADPALHPSSLDGTPSVRLTGRIMSCGAWVARCQISSQSGESLLLPHA